MDSLTKLEEIKTELRLIIDECSRSHSAEHSHWLCKTAFPQFLNSIIEKIEESDADDQGTGN